MVNDQRRIVSVVKCAFARVDFHFERIIVVRTASHQPKRRRHDATKAKNAQRSDERNPPVEILLCDTIEFDENAVKTVKYDIRAWTDCQQRQAVRW